MKNLRKSKLATLGFLFYFIFSGIGLPAQCITCNGYEIENQLLCAAEVDWEIVDGNCRSVCSGGNAIIGAGASIVVGTPVCCSSGAVDINVYVKKTGTCSYPGGGAGCTAQNLAVAGNCHCNGPVLTDGGTCPAICTLGGTGTWVIGHTPQKVIIH